MAPPTNICRGRHADRPGDEVGGRLVEVGSEVGDLTRTRKPRVSLAPSSETQGQLVGARESRNGRKKNSAKKSKVRNEEPLGTQSYRTSSKRSESFWLLIGATKPLFFCAQSESSKTSWYNFLARSPGALNPFGTLNLMERYPSSLCGPLCDINGNSLSPLGVQNKGAAFPSATQARTKMTSSVDVFDVCVVGAGVEGSSTARYLASRGKKTLLLEQVYVIYIKTYVSQSELRLAPRVWGLAEFLLSFVSLHNNISLCFLLLKNCRACIWKGFQGWKFKFRTTRHLGE